MTISFIVWEQPDIDTLNNVLEIEQTAFKDGALSEQVIVPLLHYGRVYAAVDEDDNAIACAYFLRSMDDTDTALLFGLAVLPEYRGQQIGKALLEYALSHIKQYGVFRVTTMVDPANTNALSIYREQLGFSVVDSIREAFGADEDRLLLCKQL